VSDFRVVGGPQANEGVLRDVEDAKRSGAAPAGRGETAVSPMKVWTRPVWAMAVEIAPDLWSRR